MRFALVAVLAVGMLSCQAGADKQEKEQEKVELTTMKDKFSYSIGVDIGRRLKQQPLDIDPDILTRGLKDALGGEEVLLTDDEMRETFMKARQEQTQKLSGDNKEAGEAFLLKNKDQEGVTTLPSGLQYKVVKAGSGRSPAATDTVTVHYRGRLLDGREFDSSYKRGEPTRFPVNQVIPGWQEALQLMKPGDKWEVYIPSDLAYGQQGSGPVIGPNAMLIFEMELLKVDK